LILKILPKVKLCGTKLVIVISILLMSGCDSKYCIYVIDASKNPVTGVSLLYEVVRDFQYKKFETSHNFINKAIVGVSDSEGEICFSPDYALGLEERSIAFSWFLELDKNRKTINEEILNSNGFVQFP